MSELTHSGARVRSALLRSALLTTLSLFFAPALAAANGVEYQDTQKINYFSNANGIGGHATVRITDPLDANSSDSQPKVLCAMIYVFDTHQALQECCGCPVTADGLLTLDITTDLASSNVSQSSSTPSILQDGVIRIISTLTNVSELNPPLNLPGVECDFRSRRCCDASAWSRRGRLRGPWNRELPALANPARLGDPRAECLRDRGRVRGRPAVGGNGSYCWSRFCRPRCLQFGFAVRRYSAAGQRTGSMYLRHRRELMEAASGLEPLHRGFADFSGEPGKP